MRSAIAGVTLGLGIALRAAAPAPALLARDSPEIVGDWAGALALPAAELSVVFHITRTDDGTFEATMDSPDQGAFGIPVDAVDVTNGTVLITLSAVPGGGEYEGDLLEDGQTLDGVWRQGPNELPLILKRAAATDEADTDG